MKTAFAAKTKNFYRKKIESGGRVGYTTEKLASMSTIRPSKRPRNLSELSTSQVHEFSSGTYTEKDKSSTDSNAAEGFHPLNKKYQTAKSVVMLMSKVSLSTRKTLTVL